MATHCRHPTHNCVEEHLASSGAVEIWLSVIRQQYFILTSRECSPARDGALWRYNHFKKMEGAFTFPLCSCPNDHLPHTAASSRKRTGDQESTIFFVLIKSENNPPSCWFTEEHGSSKCSTKTRSPSVCSDIWFTAEEGQHWNPQPIYSTDR